MTSLLCHGVVGILVAIAIWQMWAYEKTVYNNGKCSKCNSIYAKVSYHFLESCGYLCPKCKKVRWLALYEPHRGRCDRIGWFDLLMPWRIRS